jgi:DNA mismatch repair protein MutS
METNNLTPMLRQYFEIKKNYSDAILFFRMGDFYEMFFEDAKTAAPILEVVLTTRDKNKENSVPLCGIPYHARDTYAAKLLKQGYKVAVCEQVEDPALAKGIVRREVTAVLTPGTALEIDTADSELNRYVVSVYQDEQSMALASVDLAVGDFAIRHYHSDSKQAFLDELFRKFPKEAVVAENFQHEFKSMIKAIPELSQLVINSLADYEFNFHESCEIMRNQFHLADIEGLGLKGFDAAVIAGAVLLKYLRSVRKTAIKNISSLHFSPKENYLVIDAASFRNLEIMKNIRTTNTRGSLFSAIDLTITPMGKRLLKHWISYPLIEPEEISRRHDAVAEISQNLISRTEIRQQLKEFSDLARLNSRIALNIAAPLDLLKLRHTLALIPCIKNETAIFQAELNRNICANLDSLPHIIDLLTRSIADDPNNNINEGYFIKSGYHQELDELRSISKNAKTIIAAMEKTEKENTRISSLKIKYNKVFGYFIEVTNSHLKLIPPHYIRKQTLVNAERFITGELKELEDKIAKAEEKIKTIEKELYQTIINALMEESYHLNNNSDHLALLDVLAAGGELALRRNYIRPQLSSTANLELEIVAGRHPVIEANSSSQFIPNDTLLSANKEQILLITGPNMGGKSTYLRQNALIVILAQAGYFVPAEKVKMGIFDRIFTRIGASDSLIEGKSTFLVEMIETSIILNNCTSRSLVLLDEIGRGTSTFDGLSIAWAVIEYLHALKEKPLTLFATHYHELTELADILDRVKNYHITVREWQDSVIFLHKIAAGSTDQSFGIHVAKIAGIPLPVIERAKDILLNLEKKEINRLVKERLTGKIEKLPLKQKNLFPEDQELQIWDEIRKTLKAIDISRVTPLEALNILHYMKVKSDVFK